MQPTTERVSSRELPDIFSARADDWASAPYVEEAWRVGHLYSELRALGLEREIFDLATVGYAVVPPERFAPSGYIDDLREAVLRVAEARSGVRPDRVSGATHGDAQHPLGQFMRFVLFEDEVFEPLVTNPVLLGLVSFLAGNDVLLSLFDAMVKGPGHVSLPVHNDHGDKTSPVYPYQPQAVTANLLLSDYDDDAGPIAFLPGSHRFRREPTPAEMRGLADHLVRVNAPAGSLVLWPADTWHMAVPRRAAGLRVTILMHFCRAHLQTQADFRNTVPEPVLARNPGRFAQLMNLYGAFPFGKEDIDDSKRQGARQRFSLFDAHPLWAGHFGTGQPR